MSKEQWFADYEKKLNETGDEEQAIEYADGYFERLVEAAEIIRDRRRDERLLGTSTTRTRGTGVAGITKG